MKLAIMDIEKLYKQELRILPSASREEKAQLLEDARQGDQQARQRLILALLPTIWGYAIRWQRPPYMPALELVGVGNTVLVERLDQALQEPNPIGYLLKFAAGEMVSYRMRYQNAITTPASFDEPCEFVSILEDFDIAEPGPEQSHPDYAPLLDAVQALPTERARQFISKVFGLNQCAEDLSEIAGGNSTTKAYQAAKTLKLYHLKRMRAYLCEHYPEFARQHMREKGIDKASVYASVKIPEVTLRKLEAAKMQLLANHEKLSMNKLRQISGVNTKYASAYLARYCA